MEKLELNWGRRGFDFHYEDSAVLATTEMTKSIDLDGSDISVLFEIENLAPGSAYRFRARAANAQGWGDWSLASSHFRIPTLGDILPRGITLPRVVGMSNSGFSTLAARRRELLQSEEDDEFARQVAVISPHHQQINVSFSFSPAAARTLRAWRAHFAPRKYIVEAEVSVAEPRDGSIPLRNTYDIKGRIAVLVRGKVPLHAKVFRAQEAGAIGAVIVDNGPCDNGFDSPTCSPGSSFRDGDGFAKEDNPAPWEHIDIPAVLIRRQDWMWSA